MRKAILLMLPFAVPILVVVAFALAETGRPPYPPEQVQCVRLANRHRENEVVFISYHTNQLWNIDWAVHKSVHLPSSAAFSEGLQAIGCDLALR
jgi:hypothetical protein